MKHPTRTCASCDVPVKAVTLCRTCLASVEKDLGDVAALVSDVQRIYTTDSRTKGSDEDPLLHTRTRKRQVQVVTRSGSQWCPVDPVTVGPVLTPEPMPVGSFGRSPSTRWDADHGLGREIDVTVARQTTTGKREGGRSSETPLPFNDRAARVAREVSSRLDVCVHALHNDTEPWPAADVVAMSRWLLERSPRIAAHVAAGSIERDIRRVVDTLRRAVDRPADRWFMGPCDTTGCVEEHRIVADDGQARIEKRPTELYADPGAIIVQCRRCRAEYDIGERRAWLLAAAEDQLAHAELIGRAAPALGIEVTPSSIRNLAARKRIVAHSVDAQGRPLYRIGDVIAVAQDMLSRRAEQAAEREAKAAKKARAQARERLPSSTGRSA